MRNPTMRKQDFCTPLFISIPNIQQRLLMMCNEPSRVDSRSLVCAAKCAELNEDDCVLDHGAERTNEPWQVGEEVFLFLRVKEDLAELAHVISDNSSIDSLLPHTSHCQADSA
jgi:hypothetical protein